MSERPDSYFYMYTGDYLRDTMHLTTRQHGAYTLLLMHYYGTMKPLPSTTDTLRTIARLSERDWKVDGPIVMEFFTCEIDGWHQNRADKEIAKSQRRYERAVAGAKGRHTDKQPPSSLQAGIKQAASTCSIAANPNPNPNPITPNGVTPPYPHKITRLDKLLAAERQNWAEKETTDG